jgi:hypothetical protein
MVTAQVLNRRHLFLKSIIFHDLNPHCLSNKLWHEDCDIPSGASLDRRSREINGG